jgi:hemolysin III
MTGALIPWMGLREPVSAVVHLVTAAAGVIGHIMLIREARSRGVDSARINQLQVYGIAIIVLFVASGLYHSVTGSPAWIDLFKRVDQGAIFLLVAASSAAVLGVSPSPLGMTMSRVTWVAAGLGILTQLIFWPPSPIFSAVSYLVVAMLSMSGFGCLYKQRVKASLLPVAAGGILYLLGAIVYVSRVPVLWPGWIESHAVFHFLVTGAASAHFLFVFRYICGQAGTLCEISPT